METNGGVLNYSKASLELELNSAFEDCGLTHRSILYNRAGRCMAWNKSDGENGCFPPNAVAILNKAGVSRIRMCTQDDDASFFIINQIEFEQ